MKRQGKGKLPNKPKQANAIIVFRSKVLHKYFLEIYDDFYNSARNIGGVRVASKEGMERNDKIVKHYKGIKGDSSDPPILHKAIELY